MRDNEGLIRRWFDEVWNEKRESWNEFDFLKMYDQLGLVSLKLG